MKGVEEVKTRSGVRVAAAGIEPMPFPHTPNPSSRALPNTTKLNVKTD